MHWLLWGKVSQMLFFYDYFFVHFCSYDLIIPLKLMCSFLCPGVRHSRCFGSVRTWSESSFS